MILPPWRNIWHCLEAFLVITAGGLVLNSSQCIGDPPSQKAIRPTVSSAKGEDAGLELPEPTQLVGPVRVASALCEQVAMLSGWSVLERAHSTILSEPLLTGAGSAQPTLASSPRVCLSAKPHAGPKMNEC